MAFARPEIVEATLRKTLTGHTDHTITDAGEIRRQLQSVAKTGVAVAKGTYEDGVCGIAAPVFGEDKFARGAVAIAAPTSRAKRDVIAAIQPEVRRAAAEISNAMGIDTQPVAGHSKGLAVT